MKYHLIVLGCQMNLSDSERVKAVIENMGFGDGVILQAVIPVHVVFRQIKHGRCIRLQTVRGFQLKAGQLQDIDIRRGHSQAV